MCRIYTSLLFLSIALISLACFAVCWLLTAATYTPRYEAKAHQHQLYRYRFILLSVWPPFPYSLLLRVDSVISPFTSSFRFLAVFSARSLFPVSFRTSIIYMMPQNFSFIIILSSSIFYISVFFLPSLFFLYFLFAPPISVWYEIGGGTKNGEERHGRCSVSFSHSMSSMSFSLHITHTQRLILGD